MNKQVFLDPYRRMLSQDHLLETIVFWLYELSKTLLDQPVALGPLRHHLAVF